MGSRIRKSSDRQSSILPTEGIERKILLLRGKKVIIDADLAALYGVETRRMFRLTRQELRALISQFAISNGGRGGRTKCPYAFTCSVDGRKMKLMTEGAAIIKIVPRDSNGADGEEPCLGCNHRRGTG